MSRRPASPAARPATTHHPDVAQELACRADQFAARGRRHHPAADPMEQRHPSRVRVRAAPATPSAPKCPAPQQHRRHLIFDDGQEVLGLPDLHGADYLSA